MFIRRFWLLFEPIIEKFRWHEMRLNRSALRIHKFTHSLIIWVCMLFFHVPDASHTVFWFLMSSFTYFCKLFDRVRTSDGLFGTVLNFNIFNKYKSAKLSDYKARAVRHGVKSKYCADLWLSLGFLRHLKAKQRC